MVGRRGSNYSKNSENSIKTAAMKGSPSGHYSGRMEAPKQTVQYVIPISEVRIST